MKNKILPFSITLIFGIIFYIFYKGLDDTNIYTPNLNTKIEIPIFKTKDFYSNEIIESSNIFKIDKITNTEFVISHFKLNPLTLTDEIQAGGRINLMIGRSLTDKIRKELFDKTVKMVSQIGYEGAGTVEFIYENNKFFFFIKL